MNNNTIPICRPLAMFWLCSAVSLVLGQFGSNNGSTLTVSGIAGVIFLIVQFYPFYRFSRVSERLQRAFTMNIAGVCATVIGLLSMLLQPNSTPPYTPMGFYLLMSLIAFAGVICMFISQFWLYTGLDTVRAERGYNYPSRLIRWCFYGPLLCRIASILMAYLTQNNALQDYFSLPGQLFSLILLGLFIRAAYKAEKLTA